MKRKSSLKLAKREKGMVRVRGRVRERRHPPKERQPPKGKAAPPKKCKTPKVLDMDGAEGENFSLIKLKDSTIVGSCRVSAMFAWRRSSLAIFDKFICSFCFSVVGYRWHTPPPWALIALRSTKQIRKNIYFFHLGWRPAAEKCWKGNYNLQIFSQNSVNNFP